MFLCVITLQLSKLCQGDLHKMYNDFNTFFQLESFPKLINVVANTSCRINQDQVINLNDGIEHLSSHIMGQSHLIHYVNPLIGLHSRITRDGFEVVIKVVKAQCTTTFDLLVIELEQRFPNHELVNAFGVIYPQYQLQANCESTFAIHQNVIKQHYYTPKQLDASNSWVYESLSRETLDIQSSLFKMTKDKTF